MGHSPPVITNVISFRDNSHEEDLTVAVECDVTWESKMVRKGVHTRSAL